MCRRPSGISDHRRFVMQRAFIERSIQALLALGLVASAFAAGGATAFAAGSAPGSGGTVGAVYTETNAATANAVVIFDRAPSGALTFAADVPTGGTGTGGGLGNQGAVILGPTGRWLFAVDAGSNDIAAFRVNHPGGISLAGIVPSGGTSPVSLTASRNLLYVVNAGSDTISGFTVSAAGLTPLAGSTLPLSGTGTAPAQIQFAQGGEVLVVTEKAT